MALIQSATPTTRAAYIAYLMQQNNQDMAFLAQAIGTRLQNIARRIYAPGNDPLGAAVTAVDMFAAYGTDGVALCEVCGSVMGVLAAATGQPTPAIPPAGFVLAPNPDGSVTVTLPS